MMQAERDAALRHAASLQQSLNAALADAGACRRGLASTQQLLLQREAELKRLRGEGGRLSSPRSAGMSRRNSFQQRPHSAHAESQSAASQLAQQSDSFKGSSSGATRGAQTRALGLFDLTAAWHLYDTPTSSAAEAAAPSTAEPASAAAAEASASNVASLDLGKLLPLMQAVRWQLPSVMECRQCALLLLAQPGDQGATQGFHTSDPSVSGGGKKVVLPGKGIAAEAVRSGTVINASNAPAHPNYSKSVDLIERSVETLPGDQAEDVPLLTVPVNGVGGVPIGVLQALGRPNGEPFDSEDELLMRLAAEQFSHLVQNGMVHAATAGFSSSLMRLCRDLFSQPSPQSVLAQLEVWAKTLLGATSIRGGLATDLRNELGLEDGGALAAESGNGLLQEDGVSARHRSAVSRVLSGGGALILNADGSILSGGSDGESAGETPGTGSLLLLPLTASSGGVQAVIQAKRGGGSAFSMADVRRLAPAMSLAALALEKVSLVMEQSLEMVDVTRFSAGGSALQEMIVKIRKRATHLANARSAALYIVDHETREMWALSNSGQQICWPMSTGLVGRSALSGRPEVVQKAKEHPDYNMEVDLKVASNTSSVICVPILGADRTVLGVMQLTGRGGGSSSTASEAHDGGLGQDELPAVVAFASGVSASLENALQYERLMEASQLQHELLKCMKVLTSAIDENVVTNYVRMWLRTHVNADRATVFFADRANKQLFFKVAEHSRELRFPMTTGVAGHVATTGETLNIVNAYDDPRFNQEVDLKTGYCTKSILAVPLRTPDGKVIGVVQLINKLSNGVFDKDDVRVTTAVADLTATALQNCRIHARAIAQGSFFHACAAEDGLNKTAEAIEVRAVEMLKCRHAYVWMADVEADELAYRGQQRRAPTSANSALGHVYQNSELSNLIGSANERECSELGGLLQVGGHHGAHRAFASSGRQSVRRAVGAQSCGWSAFCKRG